ncbi:unnamed protein product [Urochloa decumbens]|uniref:Uncharacterized protein n=1 Tax=Urochloa decumbens TaxID=240449 RepID=A0ABC8WNH2_9POAL
MAAISSHLTATLPFLPTLRPRSRRLPPDAFAASVSPHRTVGVALHGSRHCNPVARRFHGSENTINFWTKQNKQALFAKQNSSSDDSSSSPDGPPVLTILAGVIVFLLVLWVIGSIVTWIVGLVFTAAKP